MMNKMEKRAPIVMSITNSPTSKAYKNNKINLKVRIFDEFEILNGLEGDIVCQCSPYHMIEPSSLGERAGLHLEILRLKSHARKKYFLGEDLKLLSLLFVEIVTESIETKIIIIISRA